MNKRTLLSAVVLIALCFTGYVFAFEITKEGIYPKIITPNGDGLNDKFFVNFSNPFDNELSATVYDTSGCEIAHMSLSADEDCFIWDGKDSGGSVVPAGAYIFQVNGEGAAYNGVVIVAR